MTNRTSGRIFAGAIVLIAAGASSCAELAGPRVDPSLSSAFSSVPFGFNNVESSFAGGPDGGLVAWAPATRGMGGGGGMCGGGLGGAFLGGLGFGHRFADPGAFSNCPFDDASGRVVCSAENRSGLTIRRSARFTDAAGTVQSAYDSITSDAINVRIAVAGTITRRNGATGEVEHDSDRTVSGLSAGSTQRTVNGTSAGRETTTGTNDEGSYTAVRVVGDTITNLVVPGATGAASYPIAGTVVRSMRVTLTYDGQSPTTSSRREVITYNGSDTATLVITRDGATQNCTLPLPRGRPVCEGS